MIQIKTNLLISVLAIPYCTGLSQHHLDHSHHRDLVGVLLGFLLYSFHGIFYSLLTACWSSLLICLTAWDLSGYVYADNYFELFYNGQLIAVTLAIAKMLMY